MTQKEKVRDLIQKVCFSCGSKCCKSTLVPVPFLLSLYPGDFSDLMNRKYTICLGYSRINDTPTFVLKSHIFGYCIFLNYETRSCNIYEHRPQVCHRFPFDPIGRSGVIKHCKLYKTVQKKNPLKLQTISDRETKKFETLKHVNEVLALHELDGSNLVERYIPYLQEHLTDQTKSLNEWGSFIIKESLHQEIETVRLYKLIEAYSKFFKQTHPFISIMVIDKDYLPVFWVRGVFKSKTKYTFKQMQELYDKKMNSYYYNEFDGSGLEGLIFYDELFKNHSTWTLVWTEMRHAMKLFIKRKKT